MGDPPTLSSAALWLILAILLGVSGAFLTGALVAGMALLTGLIAGVRIRQGLDVSPFPRFLQFIDKYVSGRERTAAGLGAAGKPDGKSDGDAPEKSNGVKPQRKL